MLAVPGHSTQLANLIGHKVTLLCRNFFYVGKLVSVEAAFVTLDNAQITWDTTRFVMLSRKVMPTEIATKKWHINIESIESFGLSD